MLAFNALDSFRIHFAFKNKGRTVPTPFLSVAKIQRSEQITKFYMSFFEHKIVIPTNIDCLPNQGQQETIETTFKRVNL